MATVFRAPKGFEPPQFDFRAPHQEYQAKEAEYIERLKAQAKRQTPGDDLVGEVITFPRGDGKALYMVWSTKPLRLVWLELGDAWSIDAAHMRGLRIGDVRRMVEGERRLSELFKVAPEAR